MNKWGFLRETSELATKAGKDKDTGLHRTGLDDYLKVIFPDAVKYWRETLAKLVKTPTWAKMIEQNAWTPAYMDAPEFSAFLDKFNADNESIFAELGILVK